MIAGKQFNIKLIGTTLNDREVPLNVFLKTLEGIQKTVYELGNQRLNDIPLGRGRKPSILAEHCELYLLKAEPGSLDATLAMPLSRHDLASEIKDFPELVLEDLHDVINSIVNKNPEDLKSVIKSSKIRNKVFKILNNILPSENTDYELCFKFGENQPLQKVIKPSDELLIEYIGEDPDNITNNDGFIEISARCKAKCLSNGDIDFKTVQVIDYELIEDTRPFRAEFIRWENQKFILSHEIVCDVSKEDDYIIINYEPLNIMAYAKTRDTAIEAFKEEFSMLYRNYSLEKDENLTFDAIELKGILKGLIEGVQLIEDGKDEGFGKELA